MLGDLGISYVRTLVPVVAGFIITLLVNWGINLDEDTTVALNALLMGLFTSAWYTLARVLETKVSEKFGWLLLAPKPPTY